MKVLAWLVRRWQGQGPASLCLLILPNTYSPPFLSSTPGGSLGQNHSLLLWVVFFFNMPIHICMHNCIHI